MERRFLTGLVAPLICISMSIIQLKCSQCNREFSRNQYEYERGLNRGHKNFFCSNKCNCLFNSSKQRLNEQYGEISGRKFTRLKWSAKNRNIDFDLTIEYLWELFLKQKRKCALSGHKLSFNGKNVSVSLDRIDSLKGYTEGNVQWIHKDVNFMKHTFSQQKFIDWCKKIVYHNKD